MVVRIVKANCLFCEQTFVYEQIKNKKKFCSSSCCRRFSTGFKVYETRCGWCMDLCIVDGGSGGRNKRFCSTECRRADAAWLSYNKGVDLRSGVECQWCFKIFDAKQVGQQFCSSECRTGLSLHLKTWGDASSCQIPVCGCGHLIQHDFGVTRLRPPRSKFCRGCRMARNKQHDVWRGPAKRLERRKIVSAGERFTKFDLIQLYGCECYLCGEIVTLDKNVPRTMLASLDHVIPIFHGGAHTVENCRVVHSRCNSIKGAKLVSMVEADHGR
jgi:5-methylcytosine-specific restriction endonuclease McrA